MKEADKLKHFVLVVDDAQDARVLLDRILTNLGATVIAVDSGDKAIEATQYQKFSGIVMDIHMPGLDGWQTMEKMRAAGVVCPGLALSGDAEAADISRSLQAGFQEHWQKPAKKSQLSLWLAALGEPA